MDVNVLKENHVDIDASLELWGDMNSYNASLKEFKESLSSKLASLENYKNATDWNNYSILAHSIKSESKYLGFMEEAEIFLQHELNGKQSNKDFIENNFETLKNTIFKMIKIINNYFGETEPPKNIIIADDSNIILNFLEKNLGETYNILKAKNGNDALAYIANNDIYAMMLDLNMPDIDGFEVLEYLKNNNLLHKIPIVIITGDDTEETIQKAFSYSVIDVLNKPFDEKNIERVLSSIKSFYEKN